MLEKLLLTKILIWICAAHADTLSSVTSKCEEKPIDLVFLLDGSASIGDEFEESLDWAVKVIEAFEPSNRSKSLRVDVVQFSTDIRHEIAAQLVTETSIEDLKSEIRSLSEGQMQAGTYPYRALDFVNKKVAPTNRPGSTKVLITVTGGKKDNDDTFTQADVDNAQFNYEYMLLFLGSGEDREMADETVLDNFVHNSEYSYVEENAYLIGISKSIINASLEDRICTATPIDLIFLIDGSESIEDDQFKDMKKYVIDVTSSFAGHEVLVDVFQFSLETVHEIVSYSVEEIPSAMDTITQMLESTRPYTALDTVNNEMLSRNDSDFKILVTLTDGRLRENKIPSVIDVAKSTYDLMQAVGVGDRVNKAQLIEFSNVGSALTIEESYFSASKVEKIVNASCEEDIIQIVPTCDATTDTVTVYVYTIPTRLGRNSSLVNDYSITIYGGSVVSTKQIRIDESTETFNALSPSTDYHITVIGNEVVGSNATIRGTTISCTTKPLFRPNVICEATTESKLTVGYSVLPEIDVVNSSTVESYTITISPTGSGDDTVVKMYGTWKATFYELAPYTDYLIAVSINKASGADIDVETGFVTCRTKVVIRPIVTCDPSTSDSVRVSYSVSGLGNTPAIIQGYTIRINNEELYNNYEINTASFPGLSPCQEYNVTVDVNVDPSIRHHVILQQGSRECRTMDNPTAPTLDVSLGESRLIGINISPLTCVTGYVIMYSMGNCGVFSFVTETTAQPTYVISDRNATDTYSITVYGKYPNEGLGPGVTSTVPASIVINCSATPPPPVTPIVPAQLILSCPCQTATESSISVSISTDPHHLVSNSSYINKYTVTLPSEDLTEVIMVDGSKTATFQGLEHSRTYTICANLEMVADAPYAVERECVDCMTRELITLDATCQFVTDSSLTVMHATVPDSTSHITGYEVQLSDGVIQHIPSGADRTSFYGLRHSTTYNFTVTANVTGECAAVKPNPAVVSCTTTHRTCTATPISLIFLIDGSDSMDDRHFIEMKKYMKKVAASFSDQNVLVDVFQFSQKTEHEIAGKSVEEFASAVDKISQRLDSTRPYTGLETVNDEMQSRDDSNFNILVTISDGKSREDKIPSVIDAAKNKYDLMLAVGVGDNLDVTQLLEFSHVPNLLTSEDVWFSPSKIEKIVNASCEEDIIQIIPSCEATADTITVYVYTIPAKLGRNALLVTDYSITISAGAAVSTKHIAIDDSTATFESLLPFTDYRVTVIGNKVAGADVAIDGTTITCTTKTLFQPDVMCMASTENKLTVSYSAPAVNDAFNSATVESFSITISPTGSSADHTIMKGYGNGTVTFYELTPYTDYLVTVSINKASGANINVEARSVNCRTKVTIRPVVTCIPSTSDSVGVSYSVSGPGNIPDIIQGYTIRQNSAEMNKSYDENKASFTGLSPCTKYQVAVDVNVDPNVRNDVILQQGSADCQTTENPLAPMLEISLAKSRTIDLTISPLTCVTGYVIIYSKSNCDGSSVETSSTVQPSYEISNREVSDNYSITVYGNYPKSGLGPGVTLEVPASAVINCKGQCDTSTISISTIISAIFSGMAFLLYFNSSVSRIRTIVEFMKPIGRFISSVWTYLYTEIAAISQRPVYTQHIQPIVELTMPFWRFFSPVWTYLYTEIRGISQRAVYTQHIQPILELMKPAIRRFISSVWTYICTRTGAISRRAVSTQRIKPIVEMMTPIGRVFSSVWTYLWNGIGARSQKEEDMQDQSKELFSPKDDINENRLNGTPLLGVFGESAPPKNDINENSLNGTKDGSVELPTPRDDVNEKRLDGTKLLVQIAELPTPKDDISENRLDETNILDQIVDLATSHDDVNENRIDGTQILDQIVDLATSHDDVNENRIDGTQLLDRIVESAPVKDVINKNHLDGIQDQNVELATPKDDINKNHMHENQDQSVELPTPKDDTDESRLDGTKLLDQIVETAPPKDDINENLPGGSQDESVELPTPKEDVNDNSIDGTKLLVQIVELPTPKDDIAENRLDGTILLDQIVELPPPKDDINENRPDETKLLDQIVIEALIPPVTPGSAPPKAAINENPLGGTQDQSVEQSTPKDDLNENRLDGTKVMSEEH